LSEGSHAIGEETDATVSAEVAFSNRTLNHSVMVYGNAMWCKRRETRCDGCLLQSKFLMRIIEI